MSSNTYQAASKSDKQIDWWGMLPFLMVHVACVAIFWVGVSPIAIAVFLVMLFSRMFGITAGYHRYFSHRAFKTSRIFQFMIAFLGASAAQKGPLWWASHHRRHHQTSDTEQDIHSPSLQGFWWAHAGWVTCKKYYNHYNRHIIHDLIKCRELRLLNRYHHAVPLLLGVILFGIGSYFEYYVPGLHTSGVQIVIWGFFASTTVLYHLTFSVNSLAHTFGHQSFKTTDTSRNNFWLALITMGEGWHNNHHRYPFSERQGFHWWEIDFTHYLLKMLSWIGIVWDLKKPPQELLRTQAVHA